MPQLFLYEMLAREKLIEQVFGEDKPSQVAIVRGWREVRRGGGWPTLVSGLGRVIGQVVHLSTDELAKLDKWDAKYRRLVIHTNKGQSWCYFYKGEPDNG